MTGENETIRAYAPRHAHAVSTARDVVSASANADVANAPIPDAVFAAVPRHRRPAADSVRVGSHARHAAETATAPSHARHDAAHKHAAATRPYEADSPEAAVPVSPDAASIPSRKDTVPIARYRIVVAGFVAAVALFAFVFAISPFNPMKALQGSDTKKDAIAPISIEEHYSQSAYADEQTDVSEEDAMLLGQIVVDGTSITDDAIAMIASAQVPYASQVGNMNQNSVGLPSGCEVVSLAVLLQSLGFDADPQEIADTFLVTDGSFATGYAGSPYGAGGGYPPGIVNAANSYLLANGGNVRAYDLTGTTFDGVKGLVMHGYPVLVWSTMYGEEPQFSNAFDDGWEWYINEHCVIVYAVEDGLVYLSDPIEGYVERDEAEFARIYDECWNMAAVIL